MIIALVSFIVLIALIILMIVLRKMQYDKTHINLLDLSDQIGGKVIRKSFANQPVFQGNYNGGILQISFSKDKIGSEHVYYINFSMGISVKSTVTITSKRWLQAMDESDNLNTENTVSIDGFVLRSTNKTLLKNLSESNKMQSILQKLEPFAYLLISPDGLLFDKQSTDILADTHVDKMKSTITDLADLVTIGF
ncbi:MAG: hypothetical protein KDD94_11410 [Calditrichaeota bacterium]|nr:hypothetical protein [Calditrichota bacterium]